MKINKFQLILLSFLAGCLFPLIAIIVFAIFTNTNLSLSSVLHIHKINPVLWVVDIAPFIFAIISFVIYQKWSEATKAVEIFQTKFNTQTGDIERMAAFAEKIGNGEYEYEAEIKEDDTLSKTILNLRDKLYESHKNESEQNWKMVGKEKISNILRLHTDINLLSYELLHTIITYTQSIQGAFYIFDETAQRLQISSSYAYNRRKYLQTEFKIGEGLVGQSAFEMDSIFRTEIPADYVTITSGILGEKKPASLLISPLITEEKLQGALEIASLSKMKPLEIDFIKEISEIIARTIYNLKMIEKTERLLRESQQMTHELRENEELLRQNAETMKLQQEELEKTNTSLQDTINEVNNSQKRLYTLLENASEVISIFDENFVVKYESPSVKNILGYAEDDLLGKETGDRVDPDYSHVLHDAFEKMIKNPDITQTFELRYKRKDGTYIWLESTGRNLLSNPAIQGIILNTRDITNRKLAEKEHRLRGRMQSLSENSPDLIIRSDLQGQFFYSNPMIEKLTGINSENFNNKNIREIGLNDTITSNLLEVLKEVENNKSKLNKEIPFPTLEGDRIMNINAIPEFNDEKILETALLVLHDITERKQFEMMIQDKNKKITESIDYAHRIQEAILPNNKLFHKHFKESFIFYKPRDVVSGDFPWIFVKGDDVYVAAIDCTGHGVPGAMLSMIGYFLINQIVAQSAVLSPGEVLDQLHVGVQKTLKQDQEGAYARDGMDVALCKINTKKNELQYAGAHRMLYKVNINAEIIEYKGTRSAIGGIPKQGHEVVSFLNHESKIEKGDSIYFFSDGITDQFGGPHGMKYSAKRIRELVVTNSSMNMNNMQKLIKNDYENWLGKGRQIDDVLLIGIKF